MSSSQQLILGEGAGGAVAANYIEDVFSTWLYTGNSSGSSTQTITNGIDLSTNGGLVWIKSRSTTYTNYLQDTIRGIQNTLVSSDTSGQSVGNDIVDSVSTSGFVASLYNGGNASGQTYASWTFRKQPKFFDVVTYTGDGSSNRNISHSLGSTPGCIIVKRTNAGGNDWWVWHRSISTGNLSGNNLIRLNLTDAATIATTDILGTASSTTFQVGFDADVNGSGNTYVAYLFAHNAGGFGLTGTDNVISCGSYVGTSANFVDVNLGYEPQWFMVKKADATGPWYIIDNMRDMSYSGTSNLQANASNAEQATVPQVIPSATGISLGYSGGGSSYNVNGVTYIYIAIRRGPMKTPTSGTSVFAPVYETNAASPYTVTTNFPVDTVISSATITSSKDVNDRLRGGTTTSFVSLFTNNTNAESSSSGSVGLGFQNNTAIIDNGYWAGAGLNVIFWNFRRAPGFFDVVCYTGNATARTISHNLGVAPEMMIVKARSSSIDWSVYVQPLGTDQQLFLNLNSAQDGTNTVWNNTAPTSSVFSIGTSFRTNTNNATYVAYLFASCPGVSKVGSYTGTGTTKQIDCGFTGGARFVLIKRTDASGDWYVWDSARGIVSGNDPYLLLNSTAAEVTNTDYVDTYSAGFEISSTAPAAINANGGSFIFLAIA